MIIKSIFCTDKSMFSTMKAQRYVSDGAKVRLGGSFSYGCSVNQWSAANTAVKKFHRKHEMGKHYQMIVGFDPADNVTVEKAARIGKRIARYFTDRYVLGAIHTNTAHTHIHFLISYTTIYGKQKGMTKSELNDLKSFVSGIAEEEHCCAVRMHNKDWESVEGLDSLTVEDSPDLEIDDSKYLGEPEEVLYNDVQENTGFRNANSLEYGFAQPKVYNNFNYKITYNYNLPQQRPNSYYGKSGFGGSSAMNSTSSIPALPINPVEQCHESTGYNCGDNQAQSQSEQLVNPFVEVSPDAHKFVVYWWEISSANKQQTIFYNFSYAQNFALERRANGYCAEVIEYKNGLPIPFCTLLKK